MKKFKWLFIISLMTVLVCYNNLDVMATEAESDTSVFKYEENEDGTITITDYNGEEESVVIPSEIDEKSVSAIGELAFDDYNVGKKLKTVSIPSSVKIIGKCVFAWCENLESVYLSEGLEKISESSFAQCGKLKTITIPSSVKTIEKHAFYYCKSLEKLTIPKTVTSVKGDAFAHCSSLIVYTDSDSDLMKDIMGGNRIGFHVNCIKHPNIIIDEAVSPTCTKKGKTEGCHCSVCHYKIPQETIKATGQHVYDNGTIILEPTTTREGIREFKCKTCTKTKEERIPKLPAPTTGSIVTQSDDSYKVTNSAESGTTNATVEYSEPKKSKTTITVPDTVTIDGITYKVTSISKNAFKNNKKIKKVIIGKNITKIEANAFSGCKNLKTITIKSKNIKSVGKNAFKGIHKKAKIKVPSSKLKKYKKLMSKKGQKSTVKIVK